MKLDYAVLVVFLPWAIPAAPAPCSGDRAATDGSSSALRCAPAVPLVVAEGSSVHLECPLGSSAVRWQRGGATLESRGATLESGGATLESEGATLESGGATLESGGATLESGGATLERGGATLESGGATLERGGATLERGGATLESGGATLGCRSRVLVDEEGALQLVLADEASSGRYSCHVGPRAACFDVRVVPRWRRVVAVDDVLLGLLCVLLLLLMAVIVNELRQKSPPSTLTPLGPLTPSVLAPPAYTA